MRITTNLIQINANVELIIRRNSDIQYIRINS